MRCGVSRRSAVEAGPVSWLKQRAEQRPGPPASRRSPLRRVARVWLRMRGCVKVRNATDPQTHATETHNGDTASCCRAGAPCVMAHTAHACWLSRAPAGHLWAGGACHGEPVQSRQPIPLHSFALLLRRARLDDRRQLWHAGAASTRCDAGTWEAFACCAALTSNL